MVPPHSQEESAEYVLGPMAAYVPAMVSDWPGWY
jgi:hypothetical protein